MENDAVDIVRFRGRLIVERFVQKENAEARMVFTVSGTRTSFKEVQDVNVPAGIN